MEKKNFRNILSIIIISLVILGNVMPVKADLSFTQEEKDYIEQVGIIKAVSMEGTAPFQYTNKKGQVVGISKRILDEISDMTGLFFDYQLYDSIDALFACDYDLVFGLSSAYVRDGLVLSHPYIKSETILYMNAAKKSSDLTNKTYAAIEGGHLPEGVKEENTTYYKTREDTLDAVDAGKADYGYGNAYSVAFYTLQNAYRNIVTVPKGKETREYSMGIPGENDLLLSIINKSIHEIDEHLMQVLILDETSHVEQKITFPMIMTSYGGQIMLVVGIIVAVLLLSIIITIRSHSQSKIENKRYELLAKISNEYLYEYYVEEDELRLSRNYDLLFETQDQLGQIRSLLIGVLKKNSLQDNSEENVEDIELLLANGEKLIFRTVSFNLLDDKGRVYSVIGKLTNVSQEIAEKKELIKRAETDGLTRLYNAQTSKDLIDHRIQNKPEDQMDALIVMDCDKFKDVNDTFGHLIGDEVLAGIGTALKLTFRESDIIGRIGGDEFCVYMEDIKDMQITRLKSKRLNGLIGGMSDEFNVSVSLGIAQLKGEKNYKELFAKADQALYQAKEKGRARAQIYEG